MENSNDFYASIVQWLSGAFFLYVFLANVFGMGVDWSGVTAMFGPGVGFWYSLGFGL